MIDLFRAAPHVRMHQGTTIVIKAGGATLARPALLRQLARQVAVVHALGARLVLVHGGGPQTDSVQRLLGEEPRMVDGRRVTSATALRALRMATLGELNAEVAAALSAEGAPAVGLAASSAGLLLARRRAPLVTSEGEVDFGEVGDVVECAPRSLEALLAQGLVPVVAPPAGDGVGGFLNVNADLAAAALAVGLGAAKLVLLTSAAGILRDAVNPESVVSTLCLGELTELERQGAFQGGMRVKSVAVRKALEGGVGRVHVVSGLDPEALVRELYTTQGAGTLVTLEPQKAPEPEPGAGDRAANRAASRAADSAEVQA